MSRNYWMVALAMLVPTHAQADLFMQTWDLLSDPAFADMHPGADGLFGTGDDVAIPGQNPLGHTYYSTFDFAPGLIFSVAGGTWEQLVDTDTGTFTFLSNDSAGTFNCPAVAGCVPVAFNDPFTGSLTVVPGPVPTASVNGGTTVGFQTFDYEYDVFTDDGTTFRITGTSYTLFPGQDPVALHGADIGGHFLTILGAATLPPLPVLAYFEQSFLGILGPSTFFTGEEWGTAILVSSVVVPVPPAVLLFGSGLGLLAVRGFGRRSRA